MEIEKKCWPEFYQEIASGKKNFEVRLANFECKPGDVLILREYDPKTEQYTGRSLMRKVTYVSKTNGLKFWTAGEIKKYGLQVIGFK